MDSFSRIYMQPAFDESFHQLWDCRFVDRFIINDGDLEAMKHLADTVCGQTFGGHGKMAVVAKEQNIVEIIKTIFSKACSGNKEKSLFDSIEDGLAWLGIKSLPAYMLN